MITVPYFCNNLLRIDSWIISGWKIQGQMKQEVRNVGKFSASTPSSGVQAKMGTKYVSIQL